jgi:anionic cell wall polymer biosynthesis LytR-Cps2A-Psr (LCP) family protein
MSSIPSELRKASRNHWQKQTCFYLSGSSNGCTVVTLYGPEALLSLLLVTCGISVDRFVGQSSYRFVGAVPLLGFLTVCNNIF